MLSAFPLGLLSLLIHLEKSVSTFYSLFPQTQLSINFIGSLQGQSHLLISISFKCVFVCVSCVSCVSRVSCVCSSARIFTCECNAYRGQKGMLDPLELELHVVVNYLTWVLEIELGSFARARCAFNC